MIHKNEVLLIGLIACLAPISVLAQPTNVNPTPGVVMKPEKIGQLGDPAPPLTVQEWIKGKPVKIQPGTNFYAIIFCTLSRANEMALTNLSALQSQYQDKGLITLVVSSESPEKLKEFVQARGNEINFTVAADDMASKTTSDYQLAFNDRMLPRAFVVGKDGAVLWHGHPLRDNMGEIVDEIATGRYNLEQTKRDMMNQEMMEAYLRLARQDDPRVASAGQIMLTVRTNDAVALCDMAFQIAADPYIGKRDLKLADAALDRAEQLSKTNAVDIAVYRSIIIFQGGDQQGGLNHAKQALTIAKTEAENAEVYNCIRLMEKKIASDKNKPASAPTKPAGQ